MLYDISARIGHVKTLVTARQHYVYECVGGVKKFKSGQALVNNSQYVTRSVT